MINSNKRSKSIFKICLILTLLVMLSACTKPSSYELKMNEIEVDSKITGCELIETWDGVGIENSFISEHGDFITLPSNKKINCSKVDTSKLGVITVTFDYKNKIYTSNVEILDTTAPELNVENEFYEVEVNNEYFDLKQLYEVKDNYYPLEELTISLSGDFDKTKTGKYNIQITVMDPSLNKSSKSLVIEVVEKDVIIKEVTIPGKTQYVQVPGSNSPSQSTSTSGSSNSSGSYYYEESWSSSGSYEVDSSVTVDFE